MNGRVYDPVLGRFLSPDPIVQNPGHSQSWNRYSYVGNSPMSYNDPSGYIRESSICGGLVMCVNDDSPDVGGSGSTMSWGRTTQTIRVSGGLYTSWQPSGQTIAGGSWEQRDYNNGWVYHARTHQTWTGVVRFGGGASTTTETETIRVNAQDRSETDKRIPEPSGPYDEIRKNPNFNVKVVGLDTAEITIDINLEIAIDEYSGITSTHLEDIVKQIESVWNTTLSKNGTSISVRTKLTTVDSGLFQEGGDILVRGIASGSNSAELGGRIYEYNYLFTYSKGNVNPNRRRDTPSHEFGHLLGLTHRRNETGSLMSYALERGLTFEDLKRVADAYGH